MPADGGIRFGQYVLQRRIARGGMAEVFLAQRDGEGIDRQVAVKRILPLHADTPDFIQMFLGEAKLAAQLSHPNIVPVYDYGKVDADYFIAMEYVEGVHAGDVIKRGRADRMPPMMIARIGADAAAALHYVHELRGPGGKPYGLVHRDVSPANLMLSFDGVVKLCDFGIAKAGALGGRPLTQAGLVRGKYAYMSPEQTVGAPLDGRSDVYALSIVLWELVVGETLVPRGDAVAAMRAIRHGKLPSIDQAAPDAPAPLVEAIRWGLTTAREQRPTAAQLSQVLHAFLRSSPELGAPAQLGAWLRSRFPRVADGLADSPAITQETPSTFSEPFAVSAPVSAPMPAVRDPGSAPRGPAAAARRDAMSETVARTHVDPAAAPTIIVADDGSGPARPRRRQRTGFDLSDLGSEPPMLGHHAGPPEMPPEAAHESAPRSPSGAAPIFASPGGAPGPRALTPGPHAPARGPHTLTPGSHAFAPGSHAAASDPHTLIPGSHAPARGPHALTPGSQALAPGSHPLTPGPHAVTPGPHAPAPGSHALAPGPHAPTLVADDAAALSSGPAAIGTPSTMVLDNADTLMRSGAFRLPVPSGPAAVPTLLDPRAGMRGSPMLGMPVLPALYGAPQPAPPPGLRFGRVAAAMAGVALLSFAIVMAVRGKPRDATSAAAIASRDMAPTAPGGTKPSDATLAAPDTVRRADATQASGSPASGKPDAAAPANPARANTEQRAASSPSATSPGAVQTGAAQTSTLRGGAATGGSAAAAGMAVLDVHTKPAGATVLIRRCRDVQGKCSVDRAAAETPIGDCPAAPCTFTLPVGSYEIVVELDGARELRTVELMSDVATSLDILFKPTPSRRPASTGKLTVRARSCRMALDGHARPAPIVDLELRPGAHRLELQCGRRPATTRSVTITAGKTTTLDLTPR